MVPGGAEEDKGRIGYHVGGQWSLRSASVPGFQLRTGSDIHHAWEHSVGLQCTLHDRGFNRCSRAGGIAE